ncbi:polysaccharide biosynthesis protein [Roseimaritima sediminicola]|uniref:polysaccharide biosynthesis protein n=1 Tax=Roseimaritima sediminicola TaxID=2662066 RepID=UPI00129854BC|nr:nucleoside-diphosphate sugar epimerase/dehydratase [Roseimaritima sediminicola]
MAPQLPAPPLACCFWPTVTRRVRTLAWLLPTLAVSLLAAFWLRYDGRLPAGAGERLAMMIPLVLAVKTAVFYFARLARCWHAYFTLQDGIRLGGVVVLATAMVAAANFFVSPSVRLPRGVILIDACLTLIMLGGYPTLRRWLRERRERRRFRHEQSPREPAAPAEAVLVAGNATCSEVFLRSLCSGTPSHYRPVGLVTDRRRMLHREVAGVPVLGLVENTANAARQAGATTVLLVSGELSGAQVRQIVQQCGQADIRVQVVPAVNRIVEGKVDFTPRSVAIEDLLGRESVSLDDTDVRHWVRGKTVLVTGSCGSIGSELSRQLLRLQPARLLLMDRSETGQFFLERELAAADAEGTIEIIVADATDRQRMEALFEQYRPELVFHAAAYKHVPLMEKHPGEAIKNIIGATRNLADLARLYDVETFVMVSTDKAVNPTSVMGCCKRVAELYAQSLDANRFAGEANASSAGCRFVTVRFGNVLGSAGSVIPVFRRQIAAGGPLTITHPDMTRFFMTIPEASGLVIQAGCVGGGGEIFVLDMGEPVRIMDLAADMVRLSGLELGVDIELEISGLRPGEKLYEELYAEEETRRPTPYPKILVADSMTMPRLQILQHVGELLELAEGDGLAVRKRLQQVVPSYRPELLGETAAAARQPAAAARQPVAAGQRAA